MAALVNRYASGVRAEERVIPHRAHAAGVGVKLSCLIVRGTTWIERTIQHQQESLETHPKRDSGGGGEGGGIIGAALFKDNSIGQHSHWFSISTI